MSAHADYPWRLRVYHEGYSSIRVERRGRWIRFDPATPPGPDEAALLTWTEPERSVGVREAIARGDRPTVIATPPVQAWLAEEGELDARSPDAPLDGVAVEVLEYEPVPYATPPEALRKVKAALARPWMAAARLRQRAALPRCAPIAAQLTLPDGGRLVHLNCALHRDTPDAWMEDAVSRWAGADWLIAGVDFGEEDAVLARLPAFGAGVVMVADLVNEARRDLGLPTRILTPLVDALVKRGLEAHPLVREAGFRFE